MKSIILSIFLFSTMICFVSCKNDKKEETPPATEMQTAPPTTPPATDVQVTPSPTPAPTQAPEPAQNAKGVWHFICPKGCPGGAGAQGTCGKCSGPLQHNTAYHAQ